ncbi:ABC transporter permease [Pseudonocardia spinosispora]|uniref:ABC transporter permease n=1 Tax=Pseudonocardia spinosispora TaxID=103441 RepID=UPI000402AD30|nr:ABC transporter permease [Pseudonocardia spinosispora]
MAIRDAFVLALRTMTTARLRTALTMLGVVLGVASVLVLTGLGNGLRDGFDREFGSLNDGVYVFPTTPSTPGAVQRQRLIEADARALGDRSRVPAVATIIPGRSGTAVVRHGVKEVNTSVHGTTAGYLHTVARSIAVGRMITDADDANGNRVAVIGPKVVEQLFDGDPHAALGARIRVGRIPMEVIGVEDDGSDHTDNMVVLPLRTSRILFAGSDGLDWIVAITHGIEHVPAAVEQINQVMDRRHGITDPGLRDFVAQATLTKIREVTKYLTLLNWLSLAVGAISLVASTLGVANIMMITVHQRRTEIGIRKAIGATRRAIVHQFLIESTMLAGIGGALGAGLGLLLTATGRHYLPLFVPDLGRPDLPVAAVAGAFGISLLIGLLAGGYPAARAAALHPIEALRT